MSRLTHLDENGAARMVNVGGKPRTNRRAVAKGRVRMSVEAFEALNRGGPKGDVLAVARVAGIMAAKRTSELIPLCHNIPLAGVQVDFVADAASKTVEIFAEVENIDRTGVEMEALTAVAVAGLTIYDMLKAVDRSMVIDGLTLIEKTGGSHIQYETEVAPTAAPVAPLPMLSPPPQPPAATPVTQTPSVSVVAKGATLPGLMPPGWSAAAERSSAPTPGPTPLDSGESHPNRSPEGPRSRPPVSQTPPRLAAMCRELTLDEAVQIRDLLVKDRVAGAYLLGDLDLPYAEHARWFGASAAPGGPLEGLLMRYSGLSMPAVLTAGSADAIDALVHHTRSLLPRRFYCHVRVEHRDAIESLYAPRAWIDMVRMGLSRDAWRRADPASLEDIEVLSHRDTGHIMALYRHYPDNFFEPALLETGLYFGYREHGELLSVAGVHVFSESYDIAVIGNIVTHSEHRGRGLASRCVGRLLETLFQRVSLVALNVQVGNEPALACYRRFGFDERCRMVESWVTAR
jgi:cyclic pyranopterin phosphate synthase